MTNLIRHPAAVAGALLLILYTATVCAVAVAFPDANWDMIAYVASILEQPGIDPASLHAQTYDMVRQKVSDGQYLVLTEDRPYRIRQADDPDAFLSMLGFYRVKMLYLEAAQLLSGWLGPVDALRAVSALSAAAFGGLTLFWLIDQRALAYAPLAIIVLVLSGFGAVARAATPDMFSAFFLLAGMLLFVQGRDLAAAAFLIVAVLARPDHLSLVGVLMVMSIVFRPVSWGAVGAFLIGLVAYVLISRASGHPGWWIQLYFSNVEFVPTLEGFDPPFSVVTYAVALVRTVVRAVVEQQWPAVLLLLIFLLALMLRRNFTFTRSESIALFSILVAIPARFVLLPLYEGRFYFVYLAVFGLILVGAFARQTGPIFASEHSRGMRSTPLGTGS